MIELVLGGVRCGKSRFAEQQAIASGKHLFYLATAQALDPEMAARIDRHRQDRANDWKTIEESCFLAQALAGTAQQDRCILLECLSLWVSNLLHYDDGSCWEKEKADLLRVLPQLPGHIIMVSNEVGCGIVPLGELSRRFVDEVGWLHQALSQICDRVTLVTAGLPLVLKG